MTEIKIIGIDPSLRNTGLAAMQFNIKTGKGQLLDLKMAYTYPQKEKRGKNLHDLNSIKSILETIESFFEHHKPDLVCAELPLGSKSSQAMLGLGVSTAVLATVKQPIILVSPFAVKKVVTTDKRKVEKSDVIDWATSRHPEGNWFIRRVKGNMVFQAKNEHIADAVAAIYAGLASKQFEEFITNYQK